MSTGYVPSRDDEREEEKNEFPWLPDLKDDSEETEEGKEPEADRNEQEEPPQAEEEAEDEPRRETRLISDEEDGLEDGLEPKKIDMRMHYALDKDGGLEEEEVLLIEEADPEDLPQEWRKKENPWKGCGQDNAYAQQGSYRPVQTEEAEAGIGEITQGSHNFAAWERFRKQQTDYAETMKEKRPATETLVEEGKPEDFERMTAGPQRRRIKGSRQITEPHGQNAVFGDLQENRWGAAADEAQGAYRDRELSPGYRAPQAGNAYTPAGTSYESSWEDQGLIRGKGQNTVASTGALPPGDAFMEEGPGLTVWTGYERHAGSAIAAQNIASPGNVSVRPSGTYGSGIPAQGDIYPGPIVSSAYHGYGHEGSQESSGRKSRAEGTEGRVVVARKENGAEAGEGERTGNTTARRYASGTDPLQKKVSAGNAQDAGRSGQAWFTAVKKSATAESRHAVSGSVTAGTSGASSFAAGKPGSPMAKAAEPVKDGKTPFTPSIPSGIKPAAGTAGLATAEKTTGTAVKRTASQTMAGHPVVMAAVSISAAADRAGGLYNSEDTENRLLSATDVVERHPAGAVAHRGLKSFLRPFSAGAATLIEKNKEKKNLLERPHSAMVNDLRGTREPAEAKKTPSRRSPAGGLYADTETRLVSDSGIGGHRGKGTLSGYADSMEARADSIRIRRLRVMKQAAEAPAAQAAQAAPQPMKPGFTAKLKMAAKAAAKKVIAGTLAGTLTTAAFAGGYMAVERSTGSIWYPAQADATVDGTTTTLTQDVVDKMFTRLSAYGINTSYEISAASGPLTIHIPGYEAGNGDVRWGDSQIIMTAGGGCILIDGGCGILSDMTLEYLAQKGVTQLTAIITHWHGDHYTGLARILNEGKIHVDALYSPPPEEIRGYDYPESRAGEKICDAVEAQGGKVVHPRAGQKMTISPVSVSIELWRKEVTGQRDSNTSVNDGSMQVYFPELYYLTTGDIIYSLPDYLEKMEGRTIKFFEVPHHGNGSRTAMGALKEHGAEVCWYNNVEPGGNMDNSGYSIAAKAARSEGFEVFKTKGNLEITASGGRVTVSGNGKVYSYDCPFNPDGGTEGFSDLVSYAKQWVGKVPYKSSVTGNDPKNERFEPLAVGRGSDCSWFVYHCLEHFGLLDEFCHSYEWGTNPDKYPGGTNIGTDLSQALPGDIVCYAYGASRYGGERKSSNSHVGIYIGEGKQIECAAGAGWVVETEVDKGHLIQIVRFRGASSAPVTYTGGESQTRHGFSAQTEAIVEQHMNDFDYYSYDSFMASVGGAGSYVRSLGGVFTKYYGRDVTVQTAGEFQEVAEYVMGLCTIWGPDYNGGGGQHNFNGDYGSGSQYGRFYKGQGANHRWWDVAPIDKTFITNKEKAMIDCGSGIFYIMNKAGLIESSYPGMGSISSAENYLARHNCYAQGGKIITRKEDLQVGDLVQMIKRVDHQWHHVAVVGEIRADGTIILYDTGNRYVNTANYKKEFITDSSGIHGVYEGYESWFGVRLKQLIQTGTVAGGMATQDLGEIKIASVKVDGDTVNKSGFKFSNLREYSTGGKQTTSVTVKYCFVDEKGEEIKADQLGGSSGISPVSYSGASSATGTEIIIPEGLGSIHLYEGWQCITATTSNQYRLRAEAGENYDSEGFAIIDGRYVIACTTTFGKVGDYLDFYKEDGIVLHCIIGEIKSQNDAGCNEWGHKNGKNIIEFLVDKNTWYSGGHGSHVNPGTATCHPEWATCVTKAVNLGQRPGGASTRGTAATAASQGQYDEQALQLVKRILSMSVLGSRYKDPTNINNYDWYCFDILDYAVCDYHGADIEYTTVGGTMACTATITVCCSLPELEKADQNYRFWEHHLVGGDYLPKSYMELSLKDYEEVFRVNLTLPAKLSQVVFSGVEQEVYSFFLQKELGAAQIAGIMGNIKAESGFNPSAQNKSGASGLFQWMGGRLQSLKYLAASKGVDWTDVQAQLEYAWREINGDGWNGHNTQKKQFLATDSPYQAAALFCNYFERCGIASEAGKRGKYAEEYYSQIMSAGQGSNIDYVQWAIATANDDSHGYSQDTRNGNPNYDCSSFVFYALKNSGFDVGNSPFATGGMPSTLKRLGFQMLPLPSESELKPGDILWWTGSGNHGHTEIYIGNGQMVGAHGQVPNGDHPNRSSADGDQGDEISVTGYRAGSFTHIFRR